MRLPGAACNLPGASSAAALVLSAVGVTGFRSTPKSSFFIAAAAKPEHLRAQTMPPWQTAFGEKAAIRAEPLSIDTCNCADEAANEAIRFHPDCPFGQERHPALISLIRNIETDRPQGIQRTALNFNGTAVKRNGKTFRMTLGSMDNGAIKIDPDEHVTMGLCVGEGLESMLSGRQMGYAPAWALLSADGIAKFPVLPGLEGLTIFRENDANGRNQKAIEECGTRWREAGRDVFALRPEIGNDLNDEIRKGR
jgi:hypothetical protein